MANDRMNSNQDKSPTGSSNSPNQTMQHEQAKASVGGDRREEKSGSDKERQEKSAIGGGSDAGSQTGEPGRARSEIEKGGSETGQGRNDPSQR